MAAIGTLPVVLGTGIHSARPAASAVGKGGLYSCTTHSLVYQTDGSSWTTWATISSGMTDPMTTRGDIIIRDASNVTARLGRGSAATVLTSDGTDIAWGAPGGGGSLVLLSQTVLGSATSTITVTGISGAYKDLVIVWRVRSASSGGFNLNMRVGSGSIDTGNNYGYFTRYDGTIGSGTTGGTAQGFIEVGSGPGSNSTAGWFGAGRAEILNYADTAKTKTVIYQNFQYSTEGTLSRVGAGAWQNVSAALDQIRLYDAGATNLDTGSALTIYGRS